MILRVEPKDPSPAMNEQAVSRLQQLLGSLNAHEFRGHAPRTLILQSVHAEWEENGWILTVIIQELSESVPQSRFGLLPERDWWTAFDLCEVIECKQPP